MIRKGMSLTEVLIAMALVALSIGGIISLLIQGIGMDQSVDYTYVATSLAKNRIERIRQIRMDSGYASLPETAETNILLDRNGNSSQSGDFKRTTIIDPSYAADLTKVTVRVSYKIRNEFTSQPVELVTALSSYNQ
jgi:prepilin-type N-terminal cleavage/methylation domain-containing protein